MAVVCLGAGLRARVHSQKLKSQPSLAEHWQLGRGCLAGQKQSDAPSEALTSSEAEANTENSFGGGRSQGPGPGVPMGPVFLGSRGHT